MKLFRSARWLFLALLLPLIPASQARAGVFVSVGFAPPVLPVYVQPPCPEPGWMWTPGYWAYGDDGYYWVPGSWVPAPYVGALWTPPYWGYEGAVYVFHPGYWGPHVGYYGGINYGFGYMGEGFAGGEWRGREFAYNTAVVNVNRTVIRNTYIDRTVIERDTVVRDSRVAYSGGPGGINHAPTARERSFMREQHMGATTMQQAHMQAARADRSSYFRLNRGQPQRAAMERPMAFNGRGSAGFQGRETGVNGNAGGRAAYRAPQQFGNQRQQNQYRLAPNQPNGYRPGGPQSGREQPMYRQPNPQPGQNRMQPQSRPQFRPEPRPESRPQFRPEPRPEARPQSRPEPRPQQGGGPRGRGR